MTRRVALYCRLSPRPDGSYEGVDAQDQWGREYAARHWPGVPVETFRDDGLSAANGGPRPGYERLREWIRAGKIAHVWAVEQTRLERTEVGWFQFAAELELGGIERVDTNRDGIVQVGEVTGGILAVVAAAEIRKLRKRVKDKLDHNAAAGIPSPACPYGFRRAVVDGVKTYEHDPAQAAVVREVADKVLAGWSLTNIARHLAGRGIVGAKGGALTSTSIKTMVTTPAVAGLRLHQQRVVGRGNWSPIIDEATWRACRDKLGAARVVTGLAGPYPVPAPGRHSARRHLLTGFAYCGVCGARIAGTLRPTARQGPKVPYYVCAPKWGGRGCVGIAAEPAERHVLNTVMRELAKDEFVAALVADDHSERREQINTELEELERRRGVLTGMWARNDLTDSEWQTGRDDLASQDRALRDQLAEIPPPLGDIDPAALTDPAVWQAMTLDERREMLGLFVRGVTVDRAKPPYNRVDLSRITVEWRAR